MVGFNFLFRKSYAWIGLPMIYFDKDQVMCLDLLYIIFYEGIQTNWVTSLY